MDKYVQYIHLVRELALLIFVAVKLAMFIYKVVIPALNYIRGNEKLHFKDPFRAKQIRLPSSPGIRRNRRKTNQNNFGALAAS